MTDTTPVCLPGEDLAELIEVLEWLVEWMGTDPDQQAAASMRRFSFGLIDLAETRQSLARFAFLLGGRHIDLEDDLHNDEEDWP